MREKLLLLVGNSHANCLANALKRKLFPVSADGLSIRVVSVGASAFPGGLVLTDGEGRRIANPVLTRALAAAESDMKRREVWLLSVIGGNFFNRLGLFRPGESTFVALRGEAISPDLNVDAFIPSDVMAAALRKQLHSLDELFSLFTRKGLAGWMHLEAPVPCGDRQWVFEHLPDDTRGLAEANGWTSLSADDVAPAEFRLRMWRAQSHVVRSIVARHGGHYILPPDSVLGTDGCRRTEYCGDAVHGNTEYGALCLSKIRDWLGEYSRSKEAA